MTSPDATDTQRSRRAGRTLRWTVLFALFIGGCSASNTANLTRANPDAPVTVVDIDETVLPEATTPPGSTVSPLPPTSPPATPTATPATPTDAATAVAENPFSGRIRQIDAAPAGAAAFAALRAPDRLPVGIRIADLGIDSAPVTNVGVNPDRTFEVPGAEEVGWYKFGPTPGSEGSAVLAAHIAFDGVDGVFRNLIDLREGAVVDIVYNDGSTQAFRVETVTDYDKQELPDSLFAKQGRSQLALITCGGVFNPELRSYESNTVAVAVPL